MRWWVKGGQMPFSGEKTSNVSKGVQNEKMGLDVGIFM